MFNINERPTGAQLEEFRKRCRLPHLFGDGTRAPARQEFADSIGMPLNTYLQYVKETRGTLMPAPSWTLLRITWDALLLAQWQREHRPKQQE